MKITKVASSNFEPHPEGLYSAVNVDVTPPVLKDTKFGAKEYFRLVFETSAPPRADGTPWCVWSREFTPSLNEKAHLRKFLRQWFGRDLSPAEEAEFDTETLLGKGAQVVIVHETSADGEKTYANIAACTPAKGEVLAASGKFVRKKDKEAKGETASYRGASKPTEKKADAVAVDNTHAGEDWTCVKVHIGKHAGVELRDLDPEAITKLLTNWLPVHEANAKQTAADKRLALALALAKEALEGGAANGDF